MVDTSVRSKEKAICAHQKGDEEAKYTGQYVGSYDKMIDKSVMVFNSFVTNASIPMHCSVQDLRLPMLLLRCGQVGWSVFGPAMNVAPPFPK